MTGEQIAPSAFSESLKLGADQVLARLVTSFATLQPEIDRFVDLCKNS